MRQALADFVETVRTAPLTARFVAGILLAGFVISTAANWPGHLSVDSILQLSEGRSGVYGNWHPPVMSWLLGILDAAWRGTGLFVGLSEAMIFGGLLVFALAGGARSWAGAGLALLFVLTPQLAIYPGIVWKDVLFAAAMLSGFAALLFAAACWGDRRLRAAGLAKAALLLVLAALARQNGMLILLFAAGALGAVAAGRATARPWRAGLAAGAGALVVLFGLTLAGKALLGLRIEGDDSPAGQIRLLQTYDLIGALRRDPHLALPALEEDEPRLAALMRGDGVRLYSPLRNDTLAASPRLSEAMWNADGAAIASDWLRLILHRPGLYLATRWAAFDAVFLTPDLGKCVPFFVGVDGPADVMAALGLKRRFGAREQALIDYGSAFEPTPLFAHGFWALVAAAVLALTLRRRRPEDLVVAAAMAAALSFAASFFVISIACDYRYVYPLDLTAMAGALYAAGDWRGLFAPWRGDRWRALAAGAIGWRGRRAGVSGSRRRRSSVG